MSADIEKMAVFDPRIVQQRPKYAVEKGALSVTNAPFNAISATTSQHTYNVYVPSENVFVDRGVEWSSTVSLQFPLTLTGCAAGVPIVVPGRDFALPALPLNQLCSTMTATINDTTSVINSQDVLNTVLRLTDYKDNRLIRTCPTMLDTYQSYVGVGSGGSGTINTPIGNFSIQRDADLVPNGAWGNLIFTDATGNPLGTSSPAFAGAGYDAIAGMPVGAAGGGTGAGTYQFYIRFSSTEKLVLSPFTFADCHEWDTGLFGINNIQLIMNLQSSPGRILRFSQAQNGGWTAPLPSAIVYPNGIAPFQNSRVNVQFLTPSLDVPLPPKSVVPYMEFPRYISQPGVAIAAGSTGQLVSQTITLPQIPDLFIIYARPTSYATTTEADWYLPPASSVDSVNSPLSVNFDNFSGLLSSVTAEQLYQMSCRNGLEMPYEQWVGYAKATVAPSLAYTGNVGVPVGCSALTGGFLVLKPSQDITLQTGQAPSLVGNFTFQFQLTVRNNTPSTVTPQLYVITANSGFFESIRGSSRIIKGVLSEQDIISAPVAPTGTRSQLARWVGSGMKGMATLLMKAPSMAKEAVGSAATGGEATGGMGAGRKKGMSSRLL